MGKIPSELRETIARNIRECRQRMFPGRGGGKKCAEEFSRFVGRNVSPQQWSPWEKGSRTPDEVRLEQMAKFFAVTVEFLRKDHQKPTPHPGMAAGAPPPPAMSVAALPSLFPDPPGSPACFFWLAHRFVNILMNEGIRIRLDRDSVESLVNLLAKKIQS